MVKATSTVTKRLASRTVLFAPGGKGGVVKLPGSAVPVLKRPAAVGASGPKNGLQWVNVIAPAYISGESLHTLPVMTHQYCIAIVYITDHNRRVHVAPACSKPAVCICDSSPQYTVTGGPATRPTVGEPLGHHPTPMKNAWSLKHGIGQPTAIDACSMSSSHMVAHYLRSVHMVALISNQVQHRFAQGSQTESSIGLSPVHTALVGGGLAHTHTTTHTCNLYIFTPHGRTAEL